MKNKTKKILAGACLGLVGMGCLTGCNKENTNNDLQSTYNLTVINDSQYGIISPVLDNETNSVTVDRGDNYTFTITPREGFEIDNLLIDGKLVDPQSIYTFENIEKDHSIGAKYSPTVVEIDKRESIKSLRLIGIKYETNGEYLGNYIGGNVVLKHNKIFSHDGVSLFEDDMIDILSTSLFPDGTNVSKTIPVNGENLIKFAEEGDATIKVEFVSSDNGQVTLSTNRPIYKTQLINIGSNYYPNVYIFDMIKTDEVFAVDAFLKDPETGTSYKSVNFTSFCLIFEAIY